MNRNNMSKNKLFAAGAHSAVKNANYFNTLGDLTYSSDEMEVLADRFRNSGIEKADDIVNLLETMIKFVNATDISIEKLRQNNKQFIPELNQYMEQILKELKKVSNHAHTATQTQNKQTMYDVVSYCNEAIKSKLAQMDTRKDKLTPLCAKAFEEYFSKSGDNKLDM